MAFFRHLGKKKKEFQFSIVINVCDNLENTKWKEEQPLFCSVTRGTKTYQTKVAIVESASAKWNEALSIKTTMYKSEKKTASGSSQAVWDPKEFMFTVKSDAKDDTLVGAKIDLARYIHENGQIQTARVCELPIKGRELVTPPSLKIVIRSYDCACPPTSPFKSIDTDAPSPAPAADANAVPKSFSEEEDAALPAASASLASDAASREKAGDTERNSSADVDQHSAASSTDSGDSEAVSSFQRPPALRMGSSEADPLERDSPTREPHSGRDRDRDSYRRPHSSRRKVSSDEHKDPVDMMESPGARQQSVSDAFDRVAAGSLPTRRASITRIDEALEHTDDRLDDLGSRRGLRGVLGEETDRPVLERDESEDVRGSGTRTGGLAGLLEKEEDSFEEDRRNRIPIRKMSTGSVESTSMAMEELVSPAHKPRVKRGFSRFVSGEVRVGSRASKSGPASQFEPPAVSSIIEDDEGEMEEDDGGNSFAQSDDDDDDDNGAGEMSVEQMKRLAMLSGQQFDNTVAHRLSVHRSPSISAAS